MEKLVTIYGLAHPITGEIRYIGKSRQPKHRLHEHIKGRDDQKMTPCKEWVRSLVNAGLEPRMVDIEQCSWDGWEERERHHIKRLRDAGCNLLNMAPGGDQPFCPPDVRTKMGNRLAKERGITFLGRVFAEGLKRSIESGDEEKAVMFSYIKKVLRESTGQKRAALNDLGMRKCGYA